jgi:hypothetical protein
MTKKSGKLPNYKLPHSGYCNFTVISYLRFFRIKFTINEFNLEKVNLASVAVQIYITARIWRIIIIRARRYLIELGNNKMKSTKLNNYILSISFALFFVNTAQAVTLIQTGDCSYSPGTPGQEHGKIFSWELYDNNKIVWTNNVPAQLIGSLTPLPPAWFYDKTAMPNATSGKLTTVTLGAFLKTPSGEEMKKYWKLSMTRPNELDDDLQSWKMEDLDDSTFEGYPLTCKVNDKPDYDGAFYDWFSQKSIKVTCLPVPEKQQGIDLIPIQWSYKTGTGKEVQESVRASFGQEVDFVALNGGGTPIGIRSGYANTDDNKSFLVSGNKDLPNTGEWRFTGIWKMKDGKTRYVKQPIIFKNCTVEEKLVGN